MCVCVYVCVCVYRACEHINTQTHTNRTTEAWLEYVKRRKQEFWDSWDQTYGKTAILAWGSALVFRINNSPVGMAAQRRFRTFRARYFPGPNDAETDDTGMDEIELAEEAHRLRLKLLLAEEEEAAILLSLAANKVLFTVKRLSVFCVLCYSTFAAIALRWRAASMSANPPFSTFFAAGPANSCSLTSNFSSCDTRAHVPHGTGIDGLPDRSKQRKIGQCASTSKRSTQRQATSPCSPRSNPPKPRLAKNWVSANPSDGR